MANKKDEKADEKDKKRDPVELASDDSFPASDPPAWTGVTTKAKDVPQRDRNK